MPFDVLTATAGDLRVLLEQRQVTSVQLVQAYLQQIRAHNDDGARLRAVISVVPEKQLLDTAAQLDRERESGKTRSLYHGIPFLAKVNTYLGRQSNAVPRLMKMLLQDNMWSAASFTLPTTCGAYALKDAVARENADVVQAVGHAPIQAHPFDRQAHLDGDSLVCLCLVVGVSVHDSYSHGGCADCALLNQGFPFPPLRTHTHPHSSGAGCHVSLFIHVGSVICSMLRLTRVLPFIFMTCGGMSNVAG